MTLFLLRFHLVLELDIKAVFAASRLVRPMIAAVLTLAIVAVILYRPVSPFLEGPPAKISDTRRPAWWRGSPGRGELAWD